MDDIILFNIFQKYNDKVNINAINRNDSIVTLLSLDSISFVTLLLEIEEQYDIQFTDPDIYRMDITVGQMIDAVEKERGGT